MDNFEGMLYEFVNPGLRERARERLRSRIGRTSAALSRLGYDEAAQRLRSVAADEQIDAAIRQLLTSGTAVPGTPELVALRRYELTLEVAVHTDTVLFADTDRIVAVNSARHAEFDPRQVLDFDIPEDEQVRAGFRIVRSAFENEFCSDIAVDHLAPDTIALVTSVMDIFDGLHEDVKLGIATDFEQLTPRTKAILRCSYECLQLRGLPIRNVTNAEIEFGAYEFDPSRDLLDYNEQSWLYGAEVQAVQPWVYERLDEQIAEMSGVRAARNQPDHGRRPIRPSVAAPDRWASIQAQLGPDVWMNLADQARAWLDQATYLYSKVRAIPIPAAITHALATAYERQVIDGLIAQFANYLIAARAGEYPRRRDKEDRTPSIVCQTRTGLRPGRIDTLADAQAVLDRTLEDQKYSSFFQTHQVDLGTILCDIEEIRRVRNSSAHDGNVSTALVLQLYAKWLRSDGPFSRAVLRKAAETAS